MKSIAENLPSIAAAASARPPLPASTYHDGSIFITSGTQRDEIWLFVLRQAAFIFPLGVNDGFF